MKHRFNKLLIVTIQKAKVFITQAKVKKKCQRFCFSQNDTEYMNSKYISAFMALKCQLYVVYTIFTEP